MKTLDAKRLPGKTLVQHLRPGDGIVLFLFFALAIGSFWFGNFVRAKEKINANPTAIIMVNNREAARMELSNPSDFKVQGALGEITLQIENNGIRVRRSSCPNQVCVSQGAVQRPGEMLVCVPNRLVVLLRGDAKPFDRIPQESRGDAVTR
jgi:hypothetical protein